MLPGVLHSTAVLYCASVDSAAGDGMYRVAGLTIELRHAGLWGDLKIVPSRMSGVLPSTSTPPAAFGYHWVCLLVRCAGCVWVHWVQRASCCVSKAG
jgi:hypothetical protein